MRPSGHEFYAVDGITYEITGLPPTESRPMTALVQGAARLANYDYRFTVNLGPSPYGGWQEYAGGAVETRIERGPNTRPPSDTALREFTECIIPAAVRVANEHPDAIIRTAQVMARMQAESLERRIADEQADIARRGEQLSADADALAQVRAFLEQGR